MTNSEGVMPAAGRRKKKPNRAFALIARMELTARGWDPQDFYSTEAANCYGATPEGLDRMLDEMGREYMKEYKAQRPESSDA